MIKIFITALLGTFVAGCGTLRSFVSDEPAEADEPVHVEGSTPKIKTSTVDEQELKVARLWARVDELEEEQFRQKEKIRVLEKGVTLGLVPEELKKGKTAEAVPPPPAPQVAAPHDVATELHAKAEVAMAHASAEAGPSANGLDKVEMDKYQAMLATAHDQFRSGRYGRAIVEFDAIGKHFGDRADSGMHRYWIARSWGSLKEFNTARQILADFLKDYPTGPWAPRAKLEIGRVEWRLGLQETALKRFRDIIQSHPYEDAAEMAKMELENLEKSL